MATYNQNDLALKVLSKLGALAIGQPVAPEDVAKVINSLAAVFDKVAAHEIVYVPDPTQIPGEWFTDLAAIVVGEIAQDFGVATDELGGLVNLGLGGAGAVPVGGGVAAKSLKIMNRGRPTGEELRTYSF